MSVDSLINAHRPQKFGQVIGQDDIVASFRTALDDRTSHAFLFIGPAGVGKTTLARLGAVYVGASDSNITEVDAATFSGIDDMRALTATLAYRPLGKNSTKAFIVDECHALSRSAWQSLLKCVEEPPEWTKWFLITTDIAKVPDTIRSRCSAYTLKPVRTNLIFDHLVAVVGAERFDTSRSVIELCAKMAEGSPRKALSNLAVCYAAKDRAEAARLIADVEAEQGGTPFALAKAIAEGWKWDRIQPLLKSMADGDENPETVRHVVRAYFTKLIIGTKDEAAACRALRVLDHFADPFNGADGFSPVVVAVGRSLF